MQYMLLIYGDEAAWDALPETQRDAIMGAYEDYSVALAQAGVLRSGAELAPVRTARTVRVRAGRTDVTDGPFAETKECLGGYYLIDVPDLETALQWAAKVPSARFGSIEVRALTENQS